MKYGFKMIVTIFVGLGGLPSRSSICVCQSLTRSSSLLAFSLDLFEFFLPLISFTIFQASADFLLFAAS